MNDFFSILFQIFLAWLFSFLLYFFWKARTMTPDDAMRAFRELPESWQKSLADDARRIREKYEKKMSRFFRIAALLVILVFALRWFAPSIYGWMMATIYMMIGVIRQ